MKIKCKRCGRILEFNVVPINFRCKCGQVWPPKDGCMASTVGNWKQAYLDLMVIHQRKRKNYYIPVIENLKAENKELQRKLDSANSTMDMVNSAIMLLDVMGYSKNKGENVENKH